jgi:hypothetical protein
VQSGLAWTTLVSAVWTSKSHTVMTEDADGPMFDRWLQDDGSVEG